MLTESKVATIQYEDSKGEVSVRDILPMSVPKDTIRALDLSGLDDAEKAKLSAHVAEYKEYMATVYKSAFTFENWAEHSYGESLDLKWRSFKVSKVTEID